MRGEVDVVVGLSCERRVAPAFENVCMCSPEHVSDSVFFRGFVSCISSVLL